MTALLTDNLPLLAGAPNGIKKLRELILELAVRGNLVPQCPADEPASELLKRIAEKKARLVAEGKIKKPKPLEEITEEKWPFVLPVGWEWSRLGNVSEYIQRGKGPVYVDQSDFRVVSQKCVRWTGLDLQPARFIAPESLVKYESIRFLRSGDILWNSTGTGTIGRACVVESCSEDEKLVADSHVTVVRPTGLLPVFLWRWIQSPSVQSELEDNASGTTNQVELNTSTVIAHLTPVPPLAEQHRVVAKVDELMALCDRLEAQQADAESAHAQLVQALLDSLTQAADAEDFATSWHRLADHFHTLFTTESSIDALKKTLLQLAVMGKLVPQDPCDEPASELLKRIVSEGSQLVVERNAKGAKFLTENEEKSKPFALPDAWEWCRVSDLISIKHGYPFSSSYFSESITSCVLTTPGNFFEVGGFRDRGERTKYYDGPVDNEFILASNDLVVAMTEQAAGLLGSTAFIPDDGKMYLHNQRLGRLRFSRELIFPGYVFYYFNGAYFRSCVANSSTGMKVKHTSPRKIGAVLFPLPPIAEQHRIVAKVDQLMALCDQLKNRLTNARQLNEQLATALVEQAVA